jgi:hypothetical protein
MLEFLIKIVSRDPPLQERGRQSSVSFGEIGAWSKANCSSINMDIREKGSYSYIILD